jgi:hypothetical protein
MLDLQRLQPQLTAFNGYQAQEQALLVAKQAQALAVLRALDGVWEQWREQQPVGRPNWLTAGLRSSPVAVVQAPVRPTPMTVVAADGSQIYPDRHVEPSCYLLNISRIAFQYGTVERPIMESVPMLKYHRADFDPFADDVLETATAETVAALRDERELQALFDIACAARLPGRPLVALADGTLIRWMLRGLRNHALEQHFIARYTQVLEGFRRERLPLASYISLPGSTEVVNLLRVVRGETEETPPEQSLAGLTDRRVFEQTLRPGERSATFESASRIQKDYGESRICFFYLHLPVRTGGTEVGRVELPRWVADEAALCDLVHAVVLSECEKGDGYPMILSEAHEQAVIRAHERERFYELIERQMVRAGMPVTSSRKAASKRRPMV